MNKNFYEETKKKIEELVSSNKYEDAFKLINEELEMPYIPVEFEKYLEEKKLQILPNIETVSNILSIDKIFELLNSDVKEIEKNELVLLLSEYNLSKYMEEIKEILVSKDINFSAKARILNSLKEQNIEEELNVFKDELIKVNLKEHKTLKENDQFIKISAELQEKLFNEPVLLNMTLDLLEDIFLQSTFDNVSIDYSTAADDLIEQTKKLFN